MKLRPDLDVLDGDIGEGVLQALYHDVREIDAVEHVDVRGDELIAAVADGSAAISPVALALNGCGVTVTDISLRTPTLDDVFLELTGNRIQEGQQ